jgi:hypothetical protein
MLLISFYSYSFLHFPIASYGSLSAPEFSFEIPFASFGFILASGPPPLRFVLGSANSLSIS